MKRLEKILCGTLETMLSGRKPRMPDVGGDILSAFLDLSRARSCHAHGPNPITWEAVAAYSQVMGRPVPQHHAAIIMALDDVWMRHASQRLSGSARGGAHDMQPVSQRPLTAALFDAILGG